MTTSPQEPGAPEQTPDLDPSPVPDPDTAQPDVVPSPAGGDPLTADPGEPMEAPD